MPSPIPYLPQSTLDKMQRDLERHGDITRQALSERILEDSAPLAAYTVVELATSAEDDNTRLAAAKYLLDRTNGKPKTSMQLNVSETNPVLQILDGVVVDRPKPATVLDQDSYEENP